jgi:hypothetical protein
MEMVFEIQLDLAVEGLLLLVNLQFYMKLVRVALPVNVQPIGTVILVIISPLLNNVIPLGDVP